MALALAVLAALVAAQPPTFRTEANYVRVDAYPTRDGAPVLDLTQSDFEVLENSAPQRIEQFEHVVIRGSVPQDLRAEPNTVAESRDAILNPRARVFVVFLDTGHVDVSGSHNIRQPLVDALNRLIGPDDLFAVMTPEMSPADLAFARRTTTIEAFLGRYWDWGDRDRLGARDAVERSYEDCYGLYDKSSVTRRMVDRRRERITLDALSDLVSNLRGVREERKAVIAITNGWILFGPDPTLAPNQPPAPPPPGVDPRSGRLSVRDPSSYDGSRSACDRDRFMLAQLDDRDALRQLPDQANRANVSFYPIDPRGLPVFDSPINNPLPLDVDAQVLRMRADALRVLADNTDGIAAVNSNDLARSFRRIVDDLSSYYLLGYYSDGKLDGKFHSITVRVKRPGVSVRARRGYLASTPAEATMLARRAGNRGATPADAPSAAAEAEAHAVEAAVSSLASYSRDAPLRLQVAAGWKSDDATSALIVVVGEIGSAAAGGDSLSEALDASATLADASDQTVAAGRTTAARGARTFRLALTPAAPIAAGQYVLRVSARAGSGSIPTRETVRLTIPAAPASAGAIFVRRGPATANKDAHTADLRFRRNEQLRVEVPGHSGAAVGARLLDRTGKPLNIPVAAAVRDDAEGAPWYTAQLALAPLAPGDYLVEITSGSGGAGGSGGSVERRTLVAFRVIP